MVIFRSQKRSASKNSLGNPALEYSSALAGVLLGYIDAHLCLIRGHFSVVLHNLSLSYCASGRMVQCCWQDLVCGQLAAVPLAPRMRKRCQDFETAFSTADQSLTDIRRRGHCRSLGVTYKTSSSSKLSQLSSLFRRPCW